jgi:hypothetical protein
MFGWVFLNRVNVLGENPISTLNTFAGIEDLYKYFPELENISILSEEGLSSLLTEIYVKMSKPGWESTLNIALEILFEKGSDPTNGATNFSMATTLEGLAGINETNSERSRPGNAYAPYFRFVIIGPDVGREGDIWINFNNLDYCFRITGIRN